MNTLEHLTQEIGEIKFVLEALEGNVKDIANVIIGNKMNPEDKGMIGRMSAYEKEISTLKLRVDKLERLKDKAIYIVIGLAVGAGYGLDKLLQLFK